MPLMNIRTSLDKVPNSDDLLKQASSQLAESTGKSEKYVMASLETNVPMKFGGTDDACCFIEVKSIGSLKPKEMAGQICQLIQDSIGISQDRIYIYFEDVSARNWGFNGSTFG